MLVDHLEDKVKGACPPLADGFRSLLEGQFVYRTRVPSTGYASQPRIEPFKDLQLVSFITVYFLNPSYHSLFLLSTIVLLFAYHCSPLFSSCLL